ncbi:MAG: hypothetical protein J7L96_07990 [Bacteroidales bacterium]|nr:hypothetical protein [Bacteroidales bacterium]
MNIKPIGGCNMYEKDDVLVKIAKEWYKQKKVVVPGVAAGAVGTHALFKHVGPLQKVTTGAKEKLFKGKKIDNKVFSSIGSLSKKVTKKLDAAEQKKVVGAIVKALRWL